MRTHASNHRLLRAGPTLALICAALVAIGKGPPPTRAQSGGGYDLTWSTVDGGGWTEGAGGSYTLGGTAGQPDAGLLTGGVYTLGGGFWGGGALAALEHRIYLPLVMRGASGSP